MKRRFCTSIVLLAAGAVLAGCVVERDPYWSPYRRHWQKPHHDYPYRGYYWR